MTHATPSTCAIVSAPIPQQPAPIVGRGWLNAGCWSKFGGKTSIFSAWKDEYADLPLQAAKAAFENDLMEEGEGEDGYRTWEIAVPGDEYALRASQCGDGYTLYEVAHPQWPEVVRLGVLPNYE
jgi:hypothetical protein